MRCFHNPNLFDDNGRKGNDSILGSAGDDSIKGEDGNDTLNGGLGDNTLTGGKGKNSFIFNSFDEGVNTITDFDLKNDTLVFSAADFGGNLTAGIVESQVFTLGTVATTSEHRFIYDLEMVNSSTTAMLQEIGSR